MLCGDLNCAMVEWVVQYKIKDAKAFLFNVRDIERTIRNVSEAVMRAIAGDSSVDEVLTVRRGEINEETQKQMQKLLDSYDSGIDIVTVKLQDVNPPEAVKPAFNEVNEAKQDKEKFVNEAWQEYNREVPRASGEALKMIQEAEAYAVERVNEAKGDANRFLAMWQEYQKAKDVTRRRLYLETMSEVLPQIEKKFVIDESQTGILPLLPLESSEGKK
jgi:membrane protease subunit HflK